MQNYQKYHIFSAVHAGQLKKNEDRFNIEISIDKISNCKKRAFYQGLYQDKEQNSVLQFYPLYVV